MSLAVSSCRAILSGRVYQREAATNVRCSKAGSVNRCFKSTGTAVIHKVHGATTVCSDI